LVFHSKGLGLIDRKTAYFSMVIPIINPIALVVQ